MKRILIKKLGEATFNSLWLIMWATGFILLPIAIFALLDYPYLNWLLEHKWAIGAQLWIIFALTDATMHNYLIKDTIGHNIKWTADPHIFANIYRFGVWIGLWAYVGLPSAICLGIVFPFFQCGRLYMLRSDAGAENYKNGWWSNPSKTSTAISNSFLLWWMRLLYAAIGLTALFYFNRANLW